MEKGYNESNIDFETYHGRNHMKKSMTFLLAAAVAMFAGCGQEETVEKQPEVTVEKRLKN